MLDCSGLTTAIYPFIFHTNHFFHLVCECVNVLFFVFFHGAHPHSCKRKTFYICNVLFYVSRSQFCEEKKTMTVKTLKYDKHQHYTAVFQIVVAFSSLTNCLCLLRFHLTAGEESQLVASSLFEPSVGAEALSQCQQRIGEMQGAI